MKGILFQPDMIKAIVEGRKTQTRRVEANLKEINQKPDMWAYIQQPEHYSFYRLDITDETDHYIPHNIKSRFKVGEVVYIKEKWRVIDVDVRTLGKPKVHVKVEYGDGDITWGKYIKEGTNFTIPDTWHSPLFLQAITARYFIKILNVRPERLQEITGTDCENEGILTGYRIEWDAQYDLRRKYKSLWNTINKPPYDWDYNPWVFRREFELIPPIN